MPKFLILAFLNINGITQALLISQLLLDLYHIGSMISNYNNHRIKYTHLKHEISVKSVRSESMSTLTQKIHCSGDCPRQWAPLRKNHWRGTEQRNLTLAYKAVGDLLQPLKLRRAQPIPLNQFHKLIQRLCHLWRYQAFVRCAPKLECARYVDAYFLAVFDRRCQK